MRAYSLGTFVKWSILNHNFCPDLQIHMGWYLRREESFFILEFSIIDYHNNVIINRSLTMPDDQPNNGYCVDAPLKKCVFHFDPNIGQGQ